MLALAAAYAVTAAVGFRLGATLHDTPPLWPAAGIAIAALCIGGVRLWPGVALGTLVVVAPRGNGALLTAAIVASTTLEAVVGALLLTRARRLSRRPSACARCLRARRRAEASSRRRSARSLAPARSRSSGDALRLAFGHEWLAWFLGDAMGVIVFAPAVLVWARPDRPLPNGETRRRDCSRSSSGSSLSSIIALGGAPVIAGEDRPLIFISFPFIVWGALRLGLRTTMTCVALVAIAASLAALDARRRLRRKRNGRGRRAAAGVPGNGGGNGADRRRIRRRAPRRTRSTHGKRTSAVARIRQQLRHAAAVRGGR